MSEFIMKEGSGSTFKNLKKEQENHAAYTGSCLIAGVEYWMNTWVKQDKNGNPWFSHSFKVKGAKPAAKPATVAHAGGGFDDLDMPF